jgi:hypothetical protein
VKLTLGEERDDKTRQPHQVWGKMSTVVPLDVNVPPQNSSSSHRSGSKAQGSQRSQRSRRKHTPQSSNRSASNPKSSKHSKQKKGTPSSVLDEPTADPTEFAPDVRNLFAEIFGGLRSAFAQPAASGPAPLVPIADDDWVPAHDGVGMIRRHVLPNAIANIEHSKVSEPGGIASHVMDGASRADSQHSSPDVGSVTATLSSSAQPKQDDDVDLVAAKLMRAAIERALLEITPVS